MDQSEGKGKLVSAIELNGFSVETLFSSDVLDACETAIDTVTGYRSDVGMKRELDQEGGNDIDKPLAKKGRQMVVVPKYEDKQDKYRTKKDRKAEERWKTHGHLPRQSVVCSYVGTCQVWKSIYKIDDMPAKAGGYSAKSLKFKINKMPDILTIEEGKMLGLEVVECSGSDRPILDARSRVFVASIPPPDDPSYQACTARSFQSMEAQAAKFTFGKTDLNHTRGHDFAAINVGLSYGNGHTRPSRPSLGRFDELAKALLEDEDIQRLAAFQDAVFALWHPKAYRYYKTNLDKLWDMHPELANPLFPKSIMPTVAFNIGSRVATKKHTDPQNCPFGWCMVTALGNFDSKKGGHLVLWELGLILEFPAGACICLPSAIITHSNIPVGEGETRMSFTQYCSGEIFRYIENGFRTDRVLEENDPAIHLFRCNDRKKRLQEGCSMFSTITDLLKTPTGKKNPFGLTRSAFTCRRNDSTP